ncbi:hypothetical protein ACFIJ5_06475 [Haloimpatiens sp. FM7330]|uniref:hypothetical protein n=1 Tax=Haloimpatiens sp. FM7330 TaxID=3298610 RepID=UPI00362BBF84
MELNTKETIKKKLLDAQESVRDYQMYSGKVSDPEISSTFKEFAEQSAIQAQKLQKLLDRF